MKEIETYFILGEIRKHLIRRLDRFIAAPLRLAVYSPGGDVCVSFALVDLLAGMRVTGQLETLAMGEVCSCAPLLVAAGSPGRRFSLRSTVWGLHLPFLESAAADPAMQRSELILLQSLQDRFINFLSELTGRTRRFWLDRLLDKSMVYFDSKTARRWGLIDEVVVV